MRKLIYQADVSACAEPDHYGAVFDGSRKRLLQIMGNHQHARRVCERGNIPVSGVGKVWDASKIIGEIRITALPYFCKGKTPTFNPSVTWRTDARLIAQYIETGEPIYFSAVYERHQRHLRQFLEQADGMARDDADQLADEAIIDFGEQLNRIYDPKFSIGPQFLMLAQQLRSVRLDEAAA